jgi:PAS domain S-box-containing protein
VELGTNNLPDDAEVRGVVIVGRDVTERVRAEEEMRRRNEELERRVAERTRELEGSVADPRESEERFRTTFEQAAVGIAQLHLDGRWLRVNPKLCEILGYLCGDLLSKTFKQVTHPEDVDADLAQAKRLAGGEIDGYFLDKRYVRKDGSHVWTNPRVSLARDASGEPSYFISVVEDVDERKKAELALRSLTRREKEVLRLLDRECSNPEIAQKLRIRERTVKFHVKNAVKKLGVADRNQAAERALELDRTQGTSE